LKKDFSETEKIAFSLLALKKRFFGDQKNRFLLATRKGYFSDTENIAFPEKPERAMFRKPKKNHIFVAT
jgi:hypothetical protein